MIYKKIDIDQRLGIAERYVVEEAIEFCSEYIHIATLVGVPQNRHDCTIDGRGTRGFNVVTMDHQ